MKNALKVVSCLLVLLIFNLSFVTLSEEGSNEPSTTLDAKGLGAIPAGMKNNSKMPQFKFNDLAKASLLPSSFDMTDDFPQPGDQGEQNSCVGWAIGYAYKSYQEKLDRNWTLDSKSHLFSPAFIYNLGNKGKDNGMLMSDALDILVEKGCPTLSVMPYDASDYVKQPDFFQLRNASKYKIQSWATLDPSASHTIKEQLAEHTPVIVLIPVYPDFYLDDMNTIYDSDAGYLSGYHAVTLIGYNDALNAYKFINSWGTNYGTNGYGWMDYELLKKVYAEAYVITDIITDEAEEFEQALEAMQDERESKKLQNNTSPNCMIDFKITNNWGNGFNGEFILANKSTQSIKKWRLEFDFEHEISHFWQARIVSHIGHHYIVESYDWNGYIPPGECIKLGFFATPGWHITSPTNIVAVLE